MEIIVNSLTQFYILMKRILYFLLVFTLVATTARAGDKNKKNNAKHTESVDSLEINWLTIDEVQVEMNKKPKKVFIDVYTNWCGWCKVMDKKTFSNPDVIKYMNQNFYAVKFNAETQDSIRFMGKMWGFVPQYRANTLAAELLRGKMSYPTSVILEENFQNPQPIPGYLDVPTIEKVLKYLGENIYKTQKFEDFDKSFTPSWRQAQG